MNHDRRTTPDGPRVLVVIPARGGSKGIPRKNLRSLGGKPLIAHAIETALRLATHPYVLVTSDDDEILSVAKRLGAGIHRRAAELAQDDVTLDAVVYDAYEAAAGHTGLAFDVVVTMQPTSPLLRSSSVDQAIDTLRSEPNLDTVLTAVDDTHLRWREVEGRFEPLYESRLNRQQLPVTSRETGGAFVTRADRLRPDDRIGQRIAVQPVSGGEAIDIDAADDWALCEWYLQRSDVLFVVAGNQSVGLGHANNALAVADALARHRVAFLVDRDSDLAAGLIASRNYEVIRQRHQHLEDDVLDLAPDVVINDRLDTSAAYVTALRQAGIRVVNFEDLGQGGWMADLTINAIYPEDDHGPPRYSGHSYYCARPEFVVASPRDVSDRVERVLVTFGGTDPADLTSRTVEAIFPLLRRHGIELEVILGLGYDHDLSWATRAGIEPLRQVDDMADHMLAADLIFASAGRTVFEIACVGTPAIVIGQNERERSHMFASESLGFHRLGIAPEVTDSEISAAFASLVDDVELRRSMHERMTQLDLRGGLERVRRLIEGVIES